MQSGIEEKAVADPTAYALWGHPFLRGLRPDFLNRISGDMVPHTYAPGEYLLREGDEARHLFLVYDGKVLLEVSPPDRPALAIETIGAGQVAGCSRGSAHRRYEYSARALSSTFAISIDSPALQAACEQAPAECYQFVTRMLSVLSDRLATTQLRLAEAQRS